MIGDISKEDYKILVPEVQALVDKEGSNLPTYGYNTIQMGRYRCMGG